jgi:phosphatidylcholine synthase
MNIALNVTRAWLVHFYTATGLIAAFGAFQAMLKGDAQTVFLWLGLALFIDATDGPLARRWEVRRWIPTFDGRKLDDIVDYINYTFIPVLFAYYFGIVAGPGTIVLVVVLMVSGYGFSQEEAKTDDGFFTGFPSYWNLVIFYLYLLDLDPWVSGVVLVVFAILVFLPVKYLTWKSPVLPRLTTSLSLIWFLFLAGLMVWFESAPQWSIWVSLLYPVYHLGVSFYLYLRRLIKGETRTERQG